MQNKVYVWEVPVRVTHWINLVSLLVLAFTGVYIYSPFIVAGSSEEYIMGWFRFVHFVTAYIFVINWIVRLYWSLVGNIYSNWKSFFPFTAEKTVNLFQQMSFYALIGKKPPTTLGHNPLAGIVYFIMLLLCSISVITGFALYSLSNPGGIMNSIFGWVFSLFSIPITRLIHHSIMWLLLYFTIVHVYIVLFLNSVEKNNLLGSIFDGYKLADSEKE